FTPLGAVRRRLVDRANRGGEGPPRLRPLPADPRADPPGSPQAEAAPHPSADEDEGPDGLRRQADVAGRRALSGVRSEEEEEEFKLDDEESLFEKEDNEMRPR
ncbi:unnamed protein product, partial [Darwinula stevensoni]